MEAGERGTIELGEEFVDVTKMDWGGEGIVLRIDASGKHQVKSMRRNRNPFRAYLSSVDLGLELLGMVGVGPAS